jgi:glycosyltransferase involved in cell wall biosynthesis
VRFLRIRQDVPEVMSAADGYVLSSAWEGMPMVLLEAGAAGLPIVATQVGGNSEIVRDGECGFLVQPGDPGALAEAMLRLMELGERERQAMGQRARDQVRAHFGLTRTVERWEELYREVLSRKGLALAATLSP